MKRILTILFAMIAIAATASPVDMKTAERVAVLHYSFYAPEAISDFSVSESSVWIYEGATTFYIFTFSSGGFVLVAADDASIPVLGYSYEGDVSASDVHPAARSWFESYDRQLSEISQSGLSNAQTRPLWDRILTNNMERSVTDVNPLLTTTWDQGCYYNALCPVETGAGVGSCSHAWTGCVATTMSQIMKYHGFPSTGIGYHSYTHPDYGLQSANFSSTTYNYAAMPNNVSSPNTAVATLMYHAGVSVNMQYGAGGSGAYSEDVPFALVNYFNYAPTAELKSKDDYPVMADWWAQIRADLDAGRPVYYAGSSTASGGHAWVCDGYRTSDNKFHFNWGWSGSYNGYFAIGSLNPGGNNFNDDNRIITGIVPGNNPATWLVQNSSFSAASRGISYMHATSATVAWGVAYDGSGGGATINEFTRTTNGGETWTTGQVLGGSTYGLGNICALNANIAYVAVYNGTGNQNNTCGIYKTSNGGQTWVQLPGALQGSTSFANNVYFWNEQEGMCHGDVRDGYFEIYTTVNGGATWQRVPQANITGGTPVSGEGGWTSVIEATGENTIMFGTNKGKVYISDDRGFHWRVTSTGITPANNGGINLIAFSDPNNGIVAQTQSPVTFKRTVNGGTTWETLTPNGPMLTNDLMAVPGQPNTYVSTGAATGVTGVSYSTDAGLNWTYFGGTSSKQFLAGDFFDNTCGYAGGFNEDQNNGGMYRMIGELGSTANGAQISLNPLEFNITLTTGEQTSSPMTISNSGDAALTWSAAVDPDPTAWLMVNPASGSVPAGEAAELSVTFDATGLLPGSYNAFIVISNNSINNPSVDVPVHLTVEEATLLPPYGLEASVAGVDVNLTWNAPGGASGTIEELIYDNDGTVTGAYSYQGFTMATHMSPQGQCKILKLKYFTTVDAGDNTFNAEVYGWDDSAGTPMTELLYSTGATALDNSWLEIDISSQDLIVDGDFVVGFGSLNATTYLGYDGGLDNGRSWDYDHEGSWAAYNEAYLIRAIVQYTDGSFREISAVPAVALPGQTPLVKSARKAFCGMASAVEMPAMKRNNNAITGYNIYRNGSLIAGPVTETFYTDADLDNGVYTYYVTAAYDNGESVPSNVVEVEITGVGIEIGRHQDRISAYPNPAGNMLFIRSETPVKQLTLTDAHGNLVFSNAPEGNDMMINVSGFSAGLYLLRIETSGQVVIRKITIR